MSRLLGDGGSWHWGHGHRSHTLGYSVLPGPSLLPTMSTATLLCLPALGDWTLSSLMLFVSATLLQQSLAGSVPRSHDKRQSFDRVLGSRGLWCHQRIHPVMAPKVGGVGDDGNSEWGGRGFLGAQSCISCLDPSSCFLPPGHNEAIPLL